MKHFKGEMRIGEILVGIPEFRMFSLNNGTQIMELLHSGINKGPDFRAIREVYGRGNWENQNQKCRQFLIESKCR